MRLLVVRHQEALLRVALLKLMLAAAALLEVLLQEVHQQEEVLHLLLLLVVLQEAPLLEPLQAVLRVVPLREVLLLPHQEAAPLLAFLPEQLFEDLRAVPRARVVLVPRLREVPRLLNPEVLLLQELLLEAVQVLLFLPVPLPLQVLSLLNSSHHPQPLHLLSSAA